LLKLEEWTDIRSLRKEGYSIRAIARQTGRSRNTVHRVLRQAGPTAYQKPERHFRFDTSFASARSSSWPASAQFQFVMAQNVSSKSSDASRAIIQMDHATLQQHLRGMGYRTHGGIGKDKSESNDPRIRSLTHFSSSFTVNGTTYPYTMLGYPPRSGRTAHFRSVIVPLRMNFIGFGPNGDVSVSFDPQPAVTNIVHSPMYQDARFPNGFGQFGDMMQRATFWNKMDDEREWHVRMDAPHIMHTVNIEVTPETGQLSQDSNGNFFGNVAFIAISLG
jgi:transposase-like protein